MDANLIQLAERCEAAEGPSRELDALIAAAFGMKHGPDSGWCNKENGDYWTVDECAAYFTASIDAALTLVPEGWWEFYWRNRASVSKQMGAEWVNCTAQAATPALALVAAALRAQAKAG